MPLTGSKNRIFAPNGSRNGAGQRQHGRFHISHPVLVGSTHTRQSIDMALWVAWQKKAAGPPIPPLRARLLLRSSIRSRFAVLFLFCRRLSPRGRTQKQAKREQRSSAPKTQFNVRKSNEEQLPFDFLLVDSTRGPARCVAFVALVKAFTDVLCFILEVLPLLRYALSKNTFFHWPYLRLSRKSPSGRAILTWGCAVASRYPVQCDASIVSASERETPPFPLYDPLLQRPCFRSGPQ